ncbi:hypothetical protein GQ457_01G004040 [Hibiscus cannabinus]
MPVKEEKKDREKPRMKVIRFLSLLRLTWGYVLPCRKCLQIYVDYTNEPHQFRHIALLRRGDEAGFHPNFGAGFTLPSVPRQMAKTIGKRGKEKEGANAG